jgi:hypothetical protein
MSGFLDALAGLKTRVTSLTATKVLGAPPGEVLVRAPAVRLGAQQAAENRSNHQPGEIPEVRMLFWGAAQPGGGVTIFTTTQGFALLQDENEFVRWQTAHRIAAWVMSQSRWIETKSPRSRSSVANEILCHAHWLVGDSDMSVDYVTDPLQKVECRALGFELDEEPPPDTPAPDEGVV